MSDVIRVELDWPAQNMVTVDERRYFGMVVAGTVHLIASRCPHRGGPLHLGYVADNRLRCPWHGTAFRVDRLCDRGIPTVQRGNRVVGYVPGTSGAELSHSMVLARVEEQ